LRQIKSSFTDSSYQSGGVDPKMIVDRRAMEVAGQTADSTIFASVLPKASLNVRRPAALALLLWQIFEEPGIPESAFA
jgi:hypothetical protein